jgi:acetolactate decarboxylase
MKKKIIFIIVCAILLFSSCSVEKVEDDVLYQVSTLQALMVGEYDGVVTAEEIKGYGDTGLGTFDALDGEMIVVDGKVYKAGVDGSVTEVLGDETIPFANVVFMNYGKMIELTFDGGYDGLKFQLDMLYGEDNMPYAFVIEGWFTNIKYRSVPEQEKPYPPLTEAVEEQKVFEQELIWGTLVGFRFPEILGDMNATGYHLHFISEDREHGGHLLDIESGDVTVYGEKMEEFHVIFSDKLKPFKANVSEEEIEAVEKKD